MQLSESMIEKTLKVNELVDMEWRFGVTAANDELQQVGKVFLQLKLTIDRGGRRETVPMGIFVCLFHDLGSSCSLVCLRPLLCVSHRVISPSVLHVSPRNAKGTSAVAVIMLHVIQWKKLHLFIQQQRQRSGMRHHFLFWVLNLQVLVLKRPHVAGRRSLGTGSHCPNVLVGKFQEK